ncbi:MAG: hypothetical protein QX198_15435 [Methylococcaceae bacterium]
MFFAKSYTDADVYLEHDDVPLAERYLLGMRLFLIVLVRKGDGKKLKPRTRIKRQTCKTAVFDAGIDAQ